MSAQTATSAGNTFTDILIDQPEPTLTAKKSGGTSAVPGTILRAVIHVENWFADGDSHTFDCGAFEIDECELSGPPNVFTIKAVSTPISSSMRREEKCKAWEDTTLQAIAQDIAEDAGLSLMYEVGYGITLDRVDQLQQTDLSFLNELCGEYGVCLKVTDEKIVLFDEKAYEQKPSVAKFTSGDVKTSTNPQGRILAYHFKQDTSDCVSSAKESYKDPKSGKLVEAVFEPDDAPATGQAIVSNFRPGNLYGDPLRAWLSSVAGTPAGQSGGSQSDNPPPVTSPSGSAPPPVTSPSGISARGGSFDQDGNPTPDEPDLPGNIGTAADFSDIRADITPEAERRAMAKARAKNKNEWTVEITIVGNPKLAAGSNIDIAGFGVYDGKYFIDEAVHKVGGGYTTTVKAHRVLNGY